MTDLSVYTYRQYLPTMVPAGAHYICSDKKTDCMYVIYMNAINASNRSR